MHITHRITKSLVFAHHLVLKEHTILKKCINTCGAGWHQVQSDYKQVTIFACQLIQSTLNLWRWNFIFRARIKSPPPLSPLMAI